MAYGYCNLNWGAHRKIINFVGSNKVILDVGCASGYLDAEYHRQGGKVFGIEVNVEDAAKARDFCEDIFVGSVDQTLDVWPFRENKFDVIILGDVIEHLTDAPGVITKLASYLKQGGYFVISVPNVAYFLIRLELLFGRFNYTSGGIMDKTHLHFYTLDSLRQLLNLCHLEVLEIEFSWPSKLRFFPISPKLFALQFIVKASPRRFIKE